MAVAAHSGLIYIAMFLCLLLVMGLLLPLMFRVYRILGVSKW